MKHARGGGEDGAMLLRVVADREDVVERLAREFIHVLRALVADVNAELSHYSDGFRANRLGICAGAENFKAITGVVAQKAFGHLAACGIAGAEDEDAKLFQGHLERSAQDLIGC